MPGSDEKEPCCYIDWHMLRLPWGDQEQSARGGGGGGGGGAYFGTPCGKKKRDMR